MKGVAATCASAASPPARHLVLDGRWPICPDERSRLVEDADLSVEIHRETTGIGDYHRAAMWPFGRRRPAQVEAELPAELAAIGDETPVRLSIVLRDGDEIDAARDELIARMGAEVSVEPQRGGVLDVVTAFQPGSAAVLRPLHVLDRAGLAVAGLEIHGLVSDLPDGALARVVDDWRANGNRGPYRRRVERLAGAQLLERCLTAADEAGAAGDPNAAAWRFAVRCAAFNTPGAQARLLDEAASSDPRRAEWLVEAASDRVQLARLAGLEADVPAASLASVLSLRGFVAERAAHLASNLPGPLDGAVASALRDLARRGGDAAYVALHALNAADPTPDVRATADEALASDDSNVRAAGLALLARHWTDAARPIWRESLASKSAPMRWTAESLIGEYGAEEDLAPAAAHLSKLVRSKPVIATSPPRGNEIIDLLVRHRDHAVARTALEDLSARWARLSDDLRAWLLDHHPWLAPADAAPAPADATDALPDEDELVFPSPTVEAEVDGALRLWFDEAAAHHPVRDRFEELMAQHPSVEILDGDREWLSVRVSGGEAEAMIAELWDAAAPDR